MKIKLEFERDDFQEMIQEYFKTTGWVVLNLEDVVEQFEAAFPGGIVVEAAVNRDVKATPSSTTSTVHEDPKGDAAADFTPTEEKTDEDGNPILDYASLTGPQDDDDDSPDEISNILKQSETLKRT